MSDKWKDSLNLPQTDFPMRGNLPEREPEFIALWQKEKIYESWQTRRGESFILHDGPPYANGDIHLGHALNKILKDMLVKFHALTGKRVPYIPGWDCHGLPIEAQVNKELGKKILELNDEELRQACRNYALTQVAKQQEGFERLGVLANWQHPYLTMDPVYEANTLRGLAKLIARGQVFRRRKPVAWSITNQTALAEAELEYQDKKDTSVYVLFEVENATALTKNITAVNKNLPVYVMIWTTTPWTLPANLAVTAGANIEYGLYQVTDRLILVAKERANTVFTAAGLAVPAPLATFLGKELAEAKLTYQHPFIARQGQVLNDAYVTLDSGTGLVHTAPGHGMDDYMTGLNFGLEIYCPVKANGCYDDTVPTWLEGVLVWDANALIIEHLQKSGHLFLRQDYIHSYPHDWRSKTPIIFRATDQWFIGMQENQLRELALNEIDHVNWQPSWGINRIRGMVENRPDWCISRQRKWGVPIAVLFCQDCNTPLLDVNLIEQVAKHMEQHGGASAWYRDSLAEIFGILPTCPDCHSKNLRKETDILDVWFDSGISWFAVCEQNPLLHQPVDLYLEGSDQHRGWFQTSLLLSTAIQNKAPFKQVLTHGFVVDGKGKKMSKSSGNVIAPEKIIKQYGAEILRLWVASEQFEDDMRISDEILKRVVDAYRRIRNTWRFMLSNFFDFDPTQHTVTWEKLSWLDQYVLFQWNTLCNNLKQAYAQNNFHTIYQSMIQFFTNDLSALYLDIAKDTLYVEAKESPTRRAIQTVLYQITTQSAICLSPILSFTSEEVWQHLPNKEHRPRSVFLAAWPQVSDQIPTHLAAADWNILNAVRGEVLKQLETARNLKHIGHSLDAKVILAATGKTYTTLHPHAAQLNKWLITSQAELVDGQQIGNLTLEATALPELSVAVLPAIGHKCGRCWHIQPEVNPADDGLCGRCKTVVVN